VRRGDSIVVATREVYSNCPQYIHPRAFAPRSLQEASREVIAAADTVFLATAHPVHGADASHRGGAVRAESPTRLSWPDLPGNNMFNSLGNLLMNPRCGLLFVDFERGAALRLRGRATVHDDRERVVIFESEQPF